VLLPFDGCTNSRENPSRDDKVVATQRVSKTHARACTHAKACWIHYLLVKAIGDGGSSGLVDDTEDVQASNGAGILGGRPLRISEVGRHSDNGVLELPAKVLLRGLLHLGEDDGADLLGAESLRKRPRISDRFFGAGSVGLSLSACFSLTFFGAIRREKARRQISSSYRSFPICACDLNKNVERQRRHDDGPPG
jgi:hypothetical protein